MKIYEELYMGLWLTSDQSTWELLCGLWKGEWQKTVAKFKAKTTSKMEQAEKMKEMVLYYLNNPRSEHVALPFEPRLKDECGRDVPELIRAFWYTHRPVGEEYGELFAKKDKDGTWMEIERPEDAISYPSYVTKQLTKSKPINDIKKDQPSESSIKTTSEINDSPNNVEEKSSEIQSDQNTEAPIDTEGEEDPNQIKLF